MTAHSVMGGGLLAEVLGPSGCGKTTVARGIAAHFKGLSPEVPEWPTYQAFLESPLRLAYQNQVEALCATQASILEWSQSHNSVVVDTSLERCQAIHSRYLRTVRLIDEAQFASLEYIYSRLARLLPRPRHTLYLQVDPKEAGRRIVQRGRYVDVPAQLVALDRQAALWALWLQEARRTRSVHVISADRPIEQVVASSVEIIEEATIA